MTEERISATQRVCNGKENLLRHAHKLILIWTMHNIHNINKRYRDAETNTP